MVPTIEVLIAAGLHVPAILLFEVVGNAGAAEFWHKGPIEVKVGATWLVTTTAMVVPVPHWPDAGVKLYVVVPATAVLIVAGFQVPVIPLLEVTGKAGAVLFTHSGPIAENVGVTWLVTTTAMLTVAPHCAPDGVNV